MERVTGIGGIFFTANDPDALRAWYRDRLGIDVQPWGGAVLADASNDTIWTVFPATTQHFSPSPASFMINYRVADLHALLAALRDEGCDVDPRTEESAFGKFGWVMDPEGHRVELWEPPPAAAAP